MIRGDNIDVNKLKETPILPYEGMKFPSDCFMPLKLRNGMYHVHLTYICNSVAKCTPIVSAFKSQRISQEAYYKWRKKYREEKEKYEGTEYTTPIIMFFDAIYEAESNNEQQLAGALMDSAIYDGNMDSAKYLLDKRHKWKETKAVELDTSEDTGIEINIQPMKDNFDNDEDEGE